jgi:hypothetical protein
MTVRLGAKRFNWLAAGRRWRKTTMAMAIAVEAALRGQQILWGAPTFDQVHVGWEETQRATRGIAQFRESRMEAKFPNGGMILYRSLDNPDNARGHTAYGLVIDESGDVDPAAWHEVLRPMLIDTNGWVWGIGTPKGRNWFWQEHVAATDRPDSVAWQAPTLGVRITERGLIRVPHPLENPDIPFTEIEHLWRTQPERTFRQEILAEFVESGGGVFRGIRAAATAAAQDGPEPGHEYVFGVDWGRSSDFTCVAVMDVSRRALVYLDRFNQVDYTLQRGRLTALFERFRPHTIIAEANAMGQPIIDQLQAEGLPVSGFTTTATTKSPLIDALALGFERGQIALLPDPILLAELEAYEEHLLPGGGRRFGAPQGMHDDTVMALALAWSGVGGGSWVW